MAGKSYNFFLNLIGRNKVGKGTKGAKRDLKSLAATAARVAGAIGVAYAAISVGKHYANTARQLQNINNLLGLTSNNVKALGRDLHALSQATRADSFATKNLYAQLAQAADDFGLSKEKTMKFLDLINKSVAISGASAESAGRSLFQLQQAIQGGLLRAEEMNSIFESTPEIMRRMAAGMGVSLGEIRKLSADGLVDTNRMINAILRQADTTNEAYARMTVTTDQAHTKMKNSIVQLVAEIEEANNFMGDYADWIDSISVFIDTNITKTDKLSLMVSRAGKAYMEANPHLRENTELLRENNFEQFVAIGFSDKINESVEKYNDLLEEKVDLEAALNAEKNRKIFEQGVEVEGSRPAELKRLAAEINRVKGEIKGFWPTAGKYVSGRGPDIDTTDETSLDEQKNAKKAEREAKAAAKRLEAEVAR